MPLRCSASLAVIRASAHHFGSLSSFAFASGSLSPLNSARAFAFLIWLLTASSICALMFDVSAFPSPKPFLIRSDAALSAVLIAALAASRMASRCPISHARNGS